ncbi:MAG: hypothetical protein KatS3mg003_1531 [Candidatus Nitrosocaldaceae archaeon]|nr:MAG: hypothetical protein KatS3mg003_1531 [Candidatus Nitrosocaldaceae archaeon]
MEKSLVDDLKRFLPLEARESEEYIQLAQTCPAALPRIIFKVLLYDSILHSEIINDLILLLNSSNIDSAYKECISYIKNNIDRIIENVKEEEQALKTLESKILKNTDNHLLEALMRYICDDEESHIKLLKALIKESNV